MNWTTLHSLDANPGDEVRHISGRRYRIQCRGARGEYRTTCGVVLVPHEEWRIVERRTDREDRMREQEVEGTA